MWLNVCKSMKACCFPWKKYFTDPCFPKNVTGDSRCKNLFALSDLSDEEAGLILTIAALLLIVLCLFVVVKLLNFLFKGTMASIVKRFINADFPGKFGWLTGYVAILIGTGNFIDKIKLKFNLAVSYIVLTAWAFETQAWQQKFDAAFCHWKKPRDLYLILLKVRKIYKMEMCI